MPRYLGQHDQNSKTIRRFCMEIAIKSALRRVRLPLSFADGVQHGGFIELPIAFAHAAATELLPTHHADPFDRMLLAQAKVERLVLVTHDRQFEPYGQPI